VFPVKVECSLGVGGRKDEQYDAATEGKKHRKCVAVVKNKVRQYFERQPPMRWHLDVRSLFLSFFLSGHQIEVVRQSIRFRRFGTRL
jgi:hypothetical protein